MIANTLKNMLYSRKIRKNQGRKDSWNSKTSGKIGLIIDTENFELKKELIGFYKSIGIKKEDFKVVVCGRKNELPENMNVPFLCAHEVSLKGEFKTEDIREFTKEPLSFLVCYFSENNSIANLLASETTALVKIGNSPDKYGVYDVELHTTRLEVFQHEVLKYLEILKKNY